MLQRKRSTAQRREVGKKQDLPQIGEGRVSVSFGVLDGVGLQDIGVGSDQTITISTKFLY